MEVTFEQIIFCFTANCQFWYKSNWCQNLVLQFLQLAHWVFQSTFELSGIVWVSDACHKSVEGGVNGQRWRAELRLYWRSCLQPRWQLWRSEILTHSCNCKTLGPTVNFDRDKIKRNPLLQPYVSAVDTIITTSRGSVVKSTCLHIWSKPCVLKFTCVYSMFMKGLEWFSTENRLCFGF